MFFHYDPFQKKGTIAPSGGMIPSFSYRFKIETNAEKDFCLLEKLLIFRALIITGFLFIVKRRGFRDQKILSTD